MMLGSKSNHEQSHEEGEAWLVSYADLMTLLFGFFVVLYSMSHIDERKLSAIGQDIASSLGNKSTAEKDAGYMTEARLLRAMQLLVATLNIGETAEDGVEAIEKLAAARSENKQLDEILKSDQSKMSALGAALHVDEESFDRYARVAIPSELLFKKGGATLDPAALAKLEPLVATLLKLQDVATLEVVGHSDSIPLPKNARPFNSNLALSAARAAAIADLLVVRGVPKKLVKVSGRGDAEPIFAEYDSNGRAIPANQQRNRRVEILVKRTETQ
jgi:chemotaxis protein MotB